MAFHKSNSEGDKCLKSANSTICIEGSPPDNDTTVHNNTQRENSQHISYDKGIDIILDFEKRTKALSYSMCNCCKQTKLNMRTREVNGIHYCQLCFSKKRYEHKDWQKQLPLWIDKNSNLHFELPTELIGLREGEKLLIQQISPYVPLQHLSKGAYGCKGHVCSFPQDVQEVCTVLPRLPSNVNVIRVIKQYKMEEGEIGTHTFVIRKHKVLAALHWLKAHNYLYHDIQIDESHLDWMEGNEEKELPLTHSIEVSDNSHTEIPAHWKEQEAGTEKCFGLFSVTPSNMPNNADKIVTESIEEAILDSPKSDRINFPYVSEDPVNEYSNEKLFCKAFPWLFPGGYGDFNQYREEKISVMEWINNLVYYYDGRFALDKMWIFFALNFATRQTNQKSGSYFVDGFFKEGKKTLDEIKDEIKDGNMSWIDRITYYSYRVSGSSAYWRKKKSEVLSWIAYHVEKGHGAPTLFITLSCAEYYWPDIWRLLEERYKKAGLSIPDCSGKGKTTLINDFTLIVQEYFQERVKIWLDTIGKHIFEIDHYWLRYEFAPGRGQIHCHMIAITKSQRMLKEYFSFDGNKEKQAEFLDKYLREKFRMVSMLPDGFDEKQQRQSGHPSSCYFTEVKDLAKEDEFNCLLRNQQHYCTDYCLRKRKYLYVYIPLSGPNFTRTLSLLQE